SIRCCSFAVLIFSSRRRHTRFSRDWSSDVCSPDLGVYEVNVQGGQVIYASADARFFIPGDLYEARPEGLVNLGEQKRNEWRAEQIGRASCREKVKMLVN